MDLNHYMFQDPMIPSRSGDPNTEDIRQWPHDVIGGDMQWHQPYRIGLAENYNIQHPIHHQLQQPMVSPAMQTGYRLMHSIRCPPLDNPRVMSSYQRPVGPGSMGQPMYRYSSVGYSHGQPPALRQLYPSNNQLRSLPEMHPGMHQQLQFEEPSTRMMEPQPVPVMSRGISASPSKPTANRMSELPKPPSAFSMSSINLPAKRPSMGNSTITAASPSKKIANLKNLPRWAAETRQIEKKNPQVDSPEKENKSTPQTSITRGTHFVTASVSDVLRWRKNHVFSDLERCNLLVEIVGTVFDIGGLKPVKITVHSQCLIHGVFWETDLRLDRNIILPGCLVKVVLRIPPDGKDFHFLKVSPLKDPSVAENAYRRIAYVTGLSIEKSTKR